MTFRNAVFQVHWCLGITAGVVLALVGVTGGILSFEDELLEALNPGVYTVEPAGRESLAPATLLERVAPQRPGEAIASLELSADPRDAALVGFAPKDGARRGERRHVDPYDGTLLPEPRYQGFFRTTMQLHRWLAVEDVGKQVVGASTVILVFFCLSGLYLRWPRRWGSLRTWLALDWRQKGRNFLWHLHSIVGTWVLLAYLVMSLTGLWWSYGWYREAVNTWAASAEPARPAGSAPGDDTAALRGAPPPVDIAAAWQAFDVVVPAWSTATLSIPAGGDPVSFRYLDADPAHERARNTLDLDRWTLAPVWHERYDDGSLRRKIGSSMFALHRGSFFGTAGVVAFMVASLLMPLFTISGWMLYLDRRRKQRAAAAAARAALPGAAPARETEVPATTGRAATPILVAHASQTGTAERLAWKTAATLREGGCAVEVVPLGSLAPSDLAGRRLLVVAATFGEGEAPDSARAFARQLRGHAATMDGLRYGVLALGDQAYPDSYCGFGRELDRRLHHAGGQPLFDRVEVDGDDPAALRHWQHHLGQLSGRTDAPDWAAPDYQRWRMVERRLLNPGTAGGKAFHIALVPEHAGDLHWQAGDIAEIGPRRTLGEADGTSRPPHREYSIASLPDDGSLQLLVRQMWRPDGQPGIGSGWLTITAAVDEVVDLRIRRNPGFHPPPDDRPLLLVGNGTGLAGLRAVLKARIAAGHHRNWLMFGERNAACDFHYADELQAWRDAGRIERMDLAFSREQRGPHGGRRYVQDLVRMHADAVRAWLDAGASVYVCGSLAGMAPGVDAALADIVGPDALERMAADGRYRRDVY